MAMTVFLLHSLLIAREDYRMATVKNQHYVPRFYLKSFVDDRGYLNVVRRNPIELGKVFRTKPEGVCSKNYLYEVKKRVPRDEDRFIEQGVIEAKLGKVEDQLADAYHSLLEYLDRWVLPEGEECGDLYLKLVILISSFIVRNPKWLDDVRANADVHAADLERSRFLSDDDVVAMDLNGCSGELGALVELAYLDTALFQYYEGTSLYSLIEMLLGMDCCFYKAIIGANFITASFPVYVAWEDESDTNPSAAYFPLSPNYAVVFRRKSRDDSFMSVGRLGDAQVNNLNRMLMNGNCVWDSLIARDRTCLELLAKEYLPGGR